MANAGVSSAVDALAALRECTRHDGGAEGMGPSALSLPYTDTGDFSSKAVLVVSASPRQAPNGKHQPCFAMLHRTSSLGQCLVMCTCSQC